MEYEGKEIESQVISQCVCVAHLADAISKVHTSYALMFAQTKEPSAILNIVGDRTANLMNVLGDILNEMDAVTEDDARFNDVFAEAQRLWPHEQIA